MISLENIRVLLSHVPLAGLTDEYQLLIVPNTYAYSYPCWHTPLSGNAEHAGWQFKW
jgi:hypothetical protein